MKPKHTSCWSSASVIAALLAGSALAAAPQSLGPAAGMALEEALLAVSVNGVAAAEPIAVLKGSGDRIYATGPVLAALRLTAQRPEFSRDGSNYYLLNAIPGLRVELSDATQTLLLTAQPDTLGWTRLAYADVAIGEELAGGTGGFLNYDVTGQTAAGQTSLGGTFEAGVFTRWGVGISSFVGRWARGAAELVRLDSNWTIDDPARMRSLRFGDSISRGGVGGTPLRFGGIQLARNFAVQPGFVTIALPSLRGSAALPSVVDIYVNDVLSGSRDVPPGPFEITDVPIVTGSGEVQLVVRDLLGRQMLHSHAYYAAQSLLRKGLHDYSYEAGLLRYSFGRRSNDYGAMMASATHRYGFTDNFTGEVHAEATGDVQSAGIAAGLGLPRIGHAELSLAGSRSGRGQGAQAAVGFERKTTGLSLGVRAEVNSKAYTSVGWDRGRRPPASTVHAFAGLPFGFGSLGLSYLRRDGRGEPDAEHVTANMSFRLRRLGSLLLAARKSIGGPRNVSARVALSMPLGPLRTATAGASWVNGERSVTASIQKYLPLGEGLGYRVATSAGAVNRIDAAVSAQTGFGTHDAQLTWIDGKTGVRLSTSGALGLIGRDLFAARRLSQSFAAVKVGGYANVRVYADNQLVGRTGRNGTIIVPRLRPFDRNSLRIDLSDLPWDAEVAADQRIVRPYGRHGIAVDFAARPSRAAILRILLDDGSFLPGGSAVRLNGGLEEVIVAPGGEVYLTALELRNWVVASWSTGSCRFEFDFVPTRDPQPRLGDFQCRGVRQ